MSLPELTLPTLVIGAGAWGTAVAVQFAGRAQTGYVSLWVRDPQQFELLKKHRENRRYLPGVRLPEQLVLCREFASACASWREQARAHRQSNVVQSLHGLIILATPMAGLEEAAAGLMLQLGPPEPGEAIAWLAKGLALQQQNSRLSPPPH